MSVLGFFVLLLVLLQPVVFRFLTFVVFSLLLVIVQYGKRLLHASYAAPSCIKAPETCSFGLWRKIRCPRVCSHKHSFRRNHPQSYLCKWDLPNGSNCLSFGTLSCLPSTDTTQVTDVQLKSRLPVQVTCFWQQLP